ncbi:PLDc N-terminal domain-containing protein [Sphingobacterium deserti]|uniref:Cardiolipin synthase N-terminal domain-containing protein n=1 Tax=Sphingobacterium deserti TaxID=1229276 RepID=A0A0B8T5Z3_9SPHI|nr:PLDc N-terminal domain-containing protein [Sphingobacterium deserti]KGE16218.1 hypothetical protein DI53_0051 [Sphingobacterium deserti]
MIAFINIGTIELSILSVAALALLIYVTYLIVVNESGWQRLIWILILLFVPIFGSLIYLAKHILSNSRRGNSIT